MKFERKHRYIIIIAIALFFVVYGLLNVQFHFNISKELESNVSWILTIIAVGLLFTGGTDKRRKNLNDDKSDSTNNLDSINNSDNTDLMDNADLTNGTDKTNDTDAPNSIDRINDTDSANSPDATNNINAVHSRD